MISNELNKLVASSLNPPTIVKINFLSSKEEVNERLSLISAENAREYFDNCSEVEIIPTVSSYIFTNKDYLKKLISLFIKCDIKYTMSDASDEIFGMDNLNDLLLNLKMNNNPECEKRALDIMGSIFTSKYTIDDVLDRINLLGSGSLNEFHKYILK